MFNKNTLLLLGLAGVAYWLWKKDNFGYEETGLAFGRPRRGNPKTTAERQATHMRQYGTDNVPPRGTGLGVRY